ncbi:malic enzyme, partial [Helicosporidium sp. ATCC 50920]
MYLRTLQRDRSAEFNRLLVGHTETILPYIYTPTVGEACARYDELRVPTYGLYIRYEDRGRVLEKLQAHSQQDVRVVVVTDGERILGLGDLGAGGMGISEGKSLLYTAAAGVPPHQVLPVCLDVGTNRTSLLESSSYTGLRRRRVTGADYAAFLDEFVDALRAWRPHVLLQFEDFGSHTAFELLERHRGRLACFNDDIQGTACVALAGLLSALRVTGQTLAQQRILFLGAGEAGTGIGELVARGAERWHGLSRAQG